MKRILSVFLALAMMIAVTSTAFAAEITAQTPSTDSSGVYQIGTAAELYGFAELVNGGETSANAVLTADIVVNQNVLNESGGLNSGDFASWTPIGSSSKNYKGAFDGQGHTISGLYFNDSSTNHVGLFGYIGDGGKVSNVGVVDSYICGNNYVGGVCGDSPYGTITGCYNTGTVNGTYYVGGVCGDIRNAITDCYNTGKVSGTYYVGGVCGSNNFGTITGCYNAGEVSGTYYVGGVCGENFGEIIGCYNTGTVNGDSSVGGVCGCSDYGSITGCYNAGTVSGTSSVGGVCGYNNGTVTSCYTNSVEVCGEDSFGSVIDCEIYSNESFANGTVLNLLNVALESTGSNVFFYQTIGTDNCPVLTDPTVTSYTVTIPEAIKIGEAVTVSATEVTLKRVETLTVAITETSEVDNTFKLRSADDAVLEYSVKSDNKNIAIGDAILKLGYTDSQGEATLNFVPEGAKFSGSYSGTVTFTVSVE